MLNLSLNNFYINPKYILNQAWIAPKPTLNKPSNSRQILNQS